MSSIFNLNRIFSPFFQQLKHFQAKSIHMISTPKYDPKVVAEIEKRFNQDKEFADVYLENYSQLYSNHNHDESAKEKIERVINVYDEMKYDLLDVPCDISPRSMRQMIGLETVGDIQRHLRKLHNKEHDSFLKQELRKLHTNDNEEFAKIRLNGIFNEKNELLYGLWRNTLFTRMPKETRSRFHIDRLRNSQLFGQNLVIDMSFSSHMTQHMSFQVVDDLGKLLSYNGHNFKEPFKITLCGVNYDSHLWKTLVNIFGKILEHANHTPEPYLKKFSNENPVYITGMERNPKPLEFDTSGTYVMAAVQERDVQKDFITPVLAKQGVKRVGIPIDHHVLWQQGSKRLSLYTRLKLLGAVRDNVSWKDALNEHVSEVNFKTDEQVLEEERLRLEKMKKLEKISKKNAKKNNKS